MLIVLSIDHRNKTFHDVCSSNPAFYSCCTVIWSNCYAQSSLEALFEDRLKEVELKEKQEIKAAMIKIHTGSSLKYLQLLANFLNVLGKVQSTSGSKLGKLNQGLKKLRDTAKLVDELTVDAREKQKRLSVKQK